MRDVCVACGRPIFTVRLRGRGVTLVQQWTHGRDRIDRQHLPIPRDHDFEVTR